MNVKSSGIIRAANGNLILSSSASGREKGQTSRSQEQGSISSALKKSRRNNCVALEQQWSNALGTSHGRSPSSHELVYNAPMAWSPLLWCIIGK